MAEQLQALIDINDRLQRELAEARAGGQPESLRDFIRRHGSDHVRSGNHDWLFSNGATIREAFDGSCSMYDPMTDPIHLLKHQLKYWKIREERAIRAWNEARQYYAELFKLSQTYANYSQFPADAKNHMRALQKAAHTATTKLNELRAAFDQTPERQAQFAKAAADEQQHQLNAAHYQDAIGIQL